MEPLSVRQNSEQSRTLSILRISGWKMKTRLDMASGLESPTLKILTFSHRGMCPKPGRPKLTTPCTTSVFIPHLDGLVSRLQALFVGNCCWLIETKPSRTMTAHPCVNIHGITSIRKSSAPRKTQIAREFQIPFMIITPKDWISTTRKGLKLQAHKVSRALMQSLLPKSNPRTFPIPLVLKPITYKTPTRISSIQYKRNLTQNQDGR